MSNVIHLNTAAFPKTKESGKPVLIDFWAPSAGRRLPSSPLPLAPLAESEPRCGPCRMQGPILDQVSSQVGERAIIAKVNVDEEPDLAATFGIQSIPTLVVLKGDQVVKRMVGVQQAGTLMGALEAAGA